MNGRGQSLVGKMLSHYQVLSHIGSGGMGEVYLARDTLLDRTVALKILPSDVATDHERMKRFEQEAKAASALDHPNVAHIYEIGESEGIRFISMQYFEGETLHNRIKTRPPDVSEIVSIAIQVADALQEAHSKRIVHRDIKPANIMINSRGQVKVVDFGLAKIFRPSGSVPATEAGVILGTVQYLSPEQALGKSVDHRSDLFSFGAVLYELSTGRLPFAGENAVESIAGILHNDVEPPRNINSQIPPELDRIIRKCLEKDVESRYQSAGDILVDLRNLKRDSETGKMRFDTASRQWVKLGQIPSPARRARIRTAIVVLLLALAAAASFYFLQLRPQKEITSVAVLPFHNSNDDPDSDYLSDGITEGVINSLSQLPDLKVLARGTVFTYKGKQVDPRQVGKELGVDAIVTGEIRQLEQQLIIQASLVDVSGGVQLWGQQFDRPVTDLLTMQSDISREISEQLRRKLTGENQRQVTKQFTENTEAYRYYLKGKYFLNKRTEEGFRNAIENFELAIQVDPGYARAYAGLADCYSLLPSWAFLAPNIGHPKAKEAARKALELDNTLAEAHATLGHTLHNYDLDWGGSEREYRKALQLNPNYATAHHWYAWLLSDLERHDEALQEIDTALGLDPISLIINADLGHMYYASRQYDRAIQQLKKTLGFDNRFTIAYQYLAYAYDAKGMHSQALEALQEAAAMSPDVLEIQGDLGWAYARVGKMDEAKEILERLLKESTYRYVVAFNIAMIYDALGDKANAVKWLETALEEHSYQMSSLSVDARVDGLRNDAGFKALMKRLKYPQRP